MDTRPHWHSEQRTRRQTSQESNHELRPNIETAAIQRWSKTTNIRVHTKRMAKWIHRVRKRFTIQNLLARCNHRTYWQEHIQKILQHFISNPHWTLQTKQAPSPDRLSWKWIMRTMWNRRNITTLFFIVPKIPPCTATNDRNCRQTQSEPESTRNGSKSIHSNSIGRTCTGHRKRVLT